MGTGREYLSRGTPEGCGENENIEPGMFKHVQEESARLSNAA